MVSKAESEALTTIKVCWQPLNWTELNSRSGTGVVNASFIMEVFPAHELTEHQPSQFRCSQSRRDADARTNERIV